MCHAPIVIPEIAGPRATQCSATTDAMRGAARRLREHQPDVLVLISPHAPRRPGSWGIVPDPELSGDFSRFGVPEVALRMPGAPRAARALAHSAGELGLSTWAASGQALDHGSLVPLHFVREAGYEGAVLVVSLPYPESQTEAVMGRAIALAAERRQERWAVLASGDMSHRLQPGAPAGYHPQATRFDARYVELIAAGQLERAARFDPELRELAAEDVVDSVAVASAAVGYDATGHQLLSYEGPFGVGYMEAVLYDDRPRGAAAGPEAGQAARDAILAVAREAIAAHLEDQAYEPASLPAPYRRSRGVFVTLRTLGGELRGCIGHLQPMYRDLAHELACCAVAAATRDSRFAPVVREELPGLRLEISLLSSPEPATEAQLDPERYGVIVAGQGRRGVLLPQVDGVDSASQQVAIATRKAGLRPDQVERLERFTVDKLVEAEGGRGA